MEDRVRVHEEFERGITKVLICTDLMTRGIDMPGMKLVSCMQVDWSLSIFVAVFLSLLVFQCPVFNRLLPP